MVFHTKTITVAFPRAETRKRPESLDATAEIVSVGPGAPYLSVTGELWQKGKLSLWGTLHGLIRDHVPEFAQLVPFHLSSWPGIPLHYINNSLFWYDQYHRDSSDLAHDPLVALAHCAALIIPGDKSALELMSMEREDVRAYLESRRFPLYAEFTTRIVDAFGLEREDLDRLNEAAAD